MNEAQFYCKVENNTVACGLCPHNCAINEGKTGICGVRRNDGGKLYAAGYGLVSSIALDPIEKKPLYLFHPGRKVLSIGGFGCNLSCPICQNCEISMEYMDIITVCAAYHHFPDTSAFAKEAGRVLKSNGIIYIADIYLPLFLRIAINPFVPLIFKDGDVRFYSPEEIVKTFKKQGFLSYGVKVSGNIQIVFMQKYQG